MNARPEAALYLEGERELGRVLNRAFQTELGCMKVPLAACPG